MIPSADTVGVGFLRWLKSVIVAPGHLGALGSILDFAGPEVGRKFRRLLFRLFGGTLAGVFYADTTEIPRFQAVLGGLFAASVYRLKTFGLENLPRNGGLLLANHITHFDAVILQLACPRPIRFIAIQVVCNHPWVGPIFRLVGADFIPMSKSGAKEAIRKAVDHIRNGGIVCIFPEGQMSQTGVLLKLQKGFELIARLAACEVVPVWMDGLFGSVPFERGKYLFKMPKRLPLVATIAFGEPIPFRAAASGLVRQKLLDLNALCFQKRPGLDVHLGRAVVSSLMRNQFDDAIIDETTGQRVKRGDLLATAIALSRWIKKHCPGKRLAIALEPGVDAAIANLASTIADKVPIDFSPASRCNAVEPSIQQGRIQYGICSEPALRRLQDGQRPEQVYLLENLIRELKPKIGLWRIVSAVLPARLLSAALRLPRKGDENEALAFFADGVSGESGGIVLSHRTVMGSVEQWDSMLKMGRGDSFLTFPSLAQPFSCAHLLWHPVIKGVRLITYSRPANVVIGAKLIEQYGVTFWLTTPDLAETYLEQAKASHLPNVKLVIGGTQQLFPELVTSLEKEFDKPVFDGYWPTETAIPVSMNLPEPTENPYDYIQPASRTGSVGRLMPGQTARIRDPETGEILSPYETGMLWLKGVNIMDGYLDTPKKSAELPHDGWFQTGDLGRFDEDGFLYLEGRVGGIPRTAQNQTIPVFTSFSCDMRKDSGQHAQLTLKKSI